MAKAIDYQVEPPVIGPTAEEELQRLLQTLHGAWRAAPCQRHGGQQRLA